MKVGEILAISKKEWDLKSFPTVFLGNYRNRTGMNWSSRPLPNGEGWAIKRTQ